MTDQEHQIVTLNVAENIPERKKQVFCIFCSKKSTKNNIRRHADHFHKAASAGEDQFILSEIL